MKRRALVFVPALLFFGLAPLAAQTTFTVNSTDDVDDGMCDGTHCSLREAIDAANANPGADIIVFGISGAGPHTIQPTSALPTVTDPVVIDGYTQSGASPNTNGPGLGSNAVLKIELDGSIAGVLKNGLHITAGSSTVRGLVINRFGENGIELETGSGNLIEGNFIGTDVTGTVALGNSVFGVAVLNGASNNTIGGTTPGARNVLSSNGQPGVTIQGVTSTGNLVQGNFIGTDVTGTVALGGGSTGGVFVFSSLNNTIGGTTAGARNIVSGNNGIGVLITGSGGLFATGNLVQGNYIGTDLTGTSALLNSSDGVRISDQASNNVVGGTSPGAGNLISGNAGAGVNITQSGADGMPSSGPTTGNLVQGNFIGTDVTGTAALPHGDGGQGNLRGGVTIVDGASNNTIGGTVTGAGNIIAFNNSAFGFGGGGGGGGIVVESGTGNTILSNSIFSNVGLGIDLVRDGVTANDLGDGDTGANDLQNFPVLASVYKGSTIIEGTLNSTPSTTFTLAFFSNSACDPSGHGEGESLLGSTMVTTDGSGDASFLVTFSTTLPTGTVITATATDPGNNTSEFSQCATVADFTIAVSPASVTVLRGEAATYTVTVSSEGGTFNGDVSLSCAGLPAQASCTFTPATVTPGASAVTSTLTVSTTAPTTPTGTFAIIGTSGSLTRSTTATLVVTTDFTIAVSPASVTVTRGSAATYTVTISPLGGSLDDPVSLACSGLPSLTSCSFAPASVTPGASDATSTLTVTTTAPSASAAPSLGQGGAIPVYPRWPGWLWLGLAGLALVTVVLRGLASRNRLLCLHVPAVVVLLVVAHLAACGGDGDGVNGPSDGTPGTSTGTFTFTITGTSGSLEHATTATLIVQ